MFFCFSTRYVPTPLRRRHSLRTIVPTINISSNSSEHTSHTSSNRSQASNSSLIKNAVLIIYEKKEDDEKRIIKETNINYGSTIDTPPTTSSTTNSATDSTLVSTANSSVLQQNYRIFIVVLCAVFLAVYVGSEVGFAAYVTTYGMKYLMTSSAVARYLSSAFWAGLAVGRLCAVPVSKYVHPILMLMVDLLGCLVVSLVFVLFLDYDRLMVTWITSVVYGFFMAPIFPCVFLIAEDMITVNGKYAGLFIFGSGIGEFFIPTIEGNIMDYFGIQKFAYFTLGLSGVLFFMCLVLLGVRKRVMFLQAIYSSS